MTYVNNFRKRTEVLLDLTKAITQQVLITQGKLPADVPDITTEEGKYRLKGTKVTRLCWYVCVGGGSQANHSVIFNYLFSRVLLPAECSTEQGHDNLPGPALYS